MFNIYERIGRQKKEKCLFFFYQPTSSLRIQCRIFQSFCLLKKKKSYSTCECYTTGYQQLMMMNRPMAKVLRPAFCIDRYTLVNTNFHQVYMYLISPQLTNPF